MPKSNYSTPNKGTKRRKMINMLLNPKGCTVNELIQAVGIKTSMQVHKNLTYLEDECGFDIRLILRIPGIRNPEYIYRIVGRHRWNGTYCSYIKAYNYD